MVVPTIRLRANAAAHARALSASQRLQEPLSGRRSAQLPVLTADRGDGGSRGRVDRGVLTTYWLVSGYGLRAWRALAWLVGITVVFALAFHLVGFTRPPQPASYWTSLLYAFRSTNSLTDDQVTLTAWGQLLQALLRLTGPVLLAWRC
jgi:hypothetical protein